MTRKHSSTPVSAVLEPADNLGAIKGIGPALAGRLHEAGIHTFHELASMSPAKLSARINTLSAAQITRQDWIGQARKLASRKVAAKVPKQASMISTTRQHYENFTIEVLLAGKNRARRTRIIHIQSGDADTWPGWKPEQLIDFLARHSQLPIPQKKAETHITEPVQTRVRQDAAIETESTTVQVPNAPPMFSSALDDAPQGSDTTCARASYAAPAQLASTLRLHNLMVSLPDSSTPISFLRQGQPYCLRLTVDPGNVAGPAGHPWRYEAKIVVRQVGGSYQTIREASGTLEGNAALSIAGDRLLPGTYRLEAIVRLLTDQAMPGSSVFLEGGLLQVY
jgi:hypothetical protein